MWIRNTLPRFRIDQVLGFQLEGVGAGCVGQPAPGRPVQQGIRQPWLAGGFSLIGNGIVLLMALWLMGRAQRRRELAAEGAALR